MSQLLVFDWGKRRSKVTQSLPTVPSRSSSLITTSYLPSILITVAGNNHNRGVSPLAPPLHPFIAFTFLTTLQPLALGWVNGGHLLGPAGWPTDASAVDGADAEVVAASSAEAMDRVFAHLHGGVVALDPGIGAGLASVSPRDTTR